MYEWLSISRTCAAIHVLLNLARNKNDCWNTYQYADVFVTKVDFVIKLTWKRVNLIQFNSVVQYMKYVYFVAFGFHIKTRLGSPFSEKFQANFLFMLGKFQDLLLGEKLWIFYVDTKIESSNASIWSFSKKMNSSILVSISTIIFVSS